MVDVLGRRIFCSTCKCYKYVRSGNSCNTCRTRRVKRNRKRTIQRLEAEKAAAAAVAAPKPAPSKRCQRIKDSMFQMSNGEHAELLHLIKTGGFVFGFPPGPDTSEWKDTDPWCEFKFPVKASSPSAKIIAYMKHYLERTVPFHIRELVRKPPLRLFINKVAGGVFPGGILTVSRKARLRVV